MASAGESQGKRPVLVIMAKAPRPGWVKTRLARSLSPENATSLYECLFADTLTLARSLESVEVAVMCPAADVADLEALTAGMAKVVPQEGQGLAAGLTSVFAHFAREDARRTVAFNSDSPHLPRRVLEDAFEKLAEYDVVVGPTHDGGYYIVGAKASHPELFAADGMGTHSALETLLARAQALGLSVGYVENFYDVDVAEDLSRLAAELRENASVAPRTADWLRRWELLSTRP